jgi:hypothetical protein
MQRRLTSPPPAEPAPPPAEPAPRIVDPAPREHEGGERGYGDPISPPTAHSSSAEGAHRERSSSTQADGAPREAGAEVVPLVMIEMDPVAVARPAVARRRSAGATGAGPLPDSRVHPDEGAGAGPVAGARVPGAAAEVVPGVRQLSLFGVEARPPAATDLEGLLAGPGQVVRMGGTARVSVVVTELWRAKVLVLEMRARGLAATCVATAEQHIGVRSAYSTALAPLGQAWLRGAVKTPPKGFMLDGRQLRLWLTAVGVPDELGFTLALGCGDEPTWGPVGAALAALGLAPVLLGPRAGGPAYRISGRRRLARLRELVGEPPTDAPPGRWPA